MNRKGDFVSTIYIVVILFIIGLLFFFVSHMNNQLFMAFDDYMNSSKYAGGEADLTLDTLIDVEQSVWDYAFLAVFILSIMSLFLTAYATRISIVFFWIYGIMSLSILVLGTILSNIWQSASSQSTFIETIARFPITNTILGTYYPMIVMAIVVILMILLFGKQTDQQGGFG